LNGEDPEAIDRKNWSLLNQNTSSSVVSSRSNRNDFKEFLYDMPYKAAPDGANTSTLAYFTNGTFTNTSISANAISISSANSKFAVGDLVYYAGNSVGLDAISFDANNIVSNAIPIATANQFAINTLVTYARSPGNTNIGISNGTYYVSYANDTHIAVSATGGGANIALTNTATTQTGHSIQKHIANGYFNVNFANASAVTLSTTGGTTNTTIRSTSGDAGALFLVPTTAFKSITDGNTVSYFSNTGALYHSYRTFAIKIVMTSDEGTHLVPRVSDMRAIALQA
jgi:hypothetical protein